MQFFTSTTMTEITEYNNLRQRVIAGFSGVIIMLAGILSGNWGFFIIFLLVCLFSQNEFYNLLRLDGKQVSNYYGIFTGILIYSCTFLAEKKILDYKFFWLLFPVLSVFFLISVYRKDIAKPFTQVALTFLGLIYIALPCSLTVVASFVKGSYSWQIATGILLLVWANDTGAYFAGKAFGKHKLFARISPKKSWEGSIGGTLLALVIATVLGIYFTDLQSWHWYCMDVIVVITGTYGDLVESMFKRSLEIKDSGNSIPGHGGFLDRFDSFLFCVPFVTAFLKIFV
jgi:phosphatidate cytidylyltransferase